MTSSIRPDLDLDLNLPDGRGVDFPPPVVPLEVYCAWLEEMFQEYVSRGVQHRAADDPTQRPVEVPFRLD